MGKINTYLNLLLRNQTDAKILHKSKSTVEISVLDSNQSTLDVMLHPTFTEEPLVPFLFNFTQILVCVRILFYLECIVHSLLTLASRNQDLIYHSCEFYDR